MESLIKSLKSVGFIAQTLYLLQLNGLVYQFYEFLRIKFLPIRVRHPFLFFQLGSTFSGVVNISTLMIQAIHTAAPIDQNAIFNVKPNQFSRLNFTVVSRQNPFPPSLKFT